MDASLSKISCWKLVVGKLVNRVSKILFIIRGGELSIKIIKYIWLKIIVRNKNKYKLLKINIK